MNRPIDVAANSSAPRDTAAIAQVVASLVQPDDVIVLGGDLGAGKTAFTKALCAQLGVTDPVTSPTFTLAQRYDGGRLQVHHLDVYRIDQIDEVIDLALPELFESKGLVVIEWGDTIAPALPANYLMVRFEFGAGDDDRRLEFSAIGPSWSARLDQLRAKLSAQLTAAQDV